METKPTIVFVNRTTQIAVQWPNEYVGSVNLHHDTKLNDFEALRRIAESVGARCIEIRPDGRYVWPFNPKN